MEAMLRRRKGHGLATHCGVSLTNIKPSMRRFWIPIRIVLMDNSAHNRFLQRILHFRWEDHVRTEELLERARKMLLFDNTKLIWRWKMIGYILGQGRNSNWVPEGRRWRPKTTSRRTVGKKKERSRLGLLGRGASSISLHNDMFCLFLLWSSCESVNSTLLMKSHSSTNETVFIRCCWGW